MIKVQQLESPGKELYGKAKEQEDTPAIGTSAQCSVGLGVRPRLSQLGPASTLIRRGPGAGRPQGPSRLPERENETWSGCAMASRSLARDLQDEATCPICLDLFSEPVSLGCGHNFCRACIDRSRGIGDAPFLCPECREPCAPHSLRPNRPLGRVAAVLRRLGPAGGRGGPCELCTEHLEPLKLFCQNDYSPICVVCDRAREHRGHHVVPLEEGAQIYREMFPEILEKLRKEMKKALKLQAEGVKTSEAWQAKVQERKQRTVSEFEKFRQLLAEEELRVLQELDEEEAEMMQVLGKEECNLAKQSRTVEELITELEALRQRPALGMLQVTLLSWQKPLYVPSPVLAATPHSADP
ncbi:PREDICTED: E3 ubiquitin-protein ligase TRIM11-like [Elephantulus edwardii]|uniref:E3 ubiquitin-protein ligase TRIM11-like n=1 Tax=Elephantulus edwardii TaxID=28737 RepID=UPI0003F0A4CD|nr:PREDICTED: E3 ubiquitin-protein ligase TRIM11-like [Elephantulus edwardii]